MSSNILAVKKTPALSVNTTSEEQTRDLARSLGRVLQPGDWLALIGELGTGKTVFAQGLAESLGSSKAATSPTFSLIQVHKTKPGKPLLRHVDLYRLAPPDISSLDWDELTDEKSVTVVEWAEKCRPYWPVHCLSIQFSHRGESLRLVEFFPVGSRAAQTVRAFKEKK